MKSAYEVALERLEQQGIQSPNDGNLSEETRSEVAEIRKRARAELAQLEIMHRDRLVRLDDPEARQTEEKQYLSERARIESRRERQISKLRETGSASSAES